MIALGWHGGIRRAFEDMEPGWSTHDGAAVVLVDGEIAAACEEERFDRVKHSNFFPRRAIEECFEIAGVALNDVTTVAMNFLDRTREIYPCDRGLPSIDLFLSDRRRSSFTVREAVGELFEHNFRTDVADRLFFCHHHVAHLWSAWAATEHDEALLVSLDGSGDGLSGLVGIGSGSGCTPICEYPTEHSLGDFYSDTIRFLGYSRFDEYKVMGLAPHGQPERYRPLFSRMYRLLPGGRYELMPRRNRWMTLYDAGILRHARRAGQDLADMHRDFAASLQETLETIVLHILACFRNETAQRHLCLAGGVAHNSSLNGRILREGGFESVFVHPAAHDAGGALGAALAAQASVQPLQRRRALRHVFLGSDIGGPGAIAQALAPWADFVSLADAPNVARSTAEELAAGAVVGWVQGRSEFGPRALGHRSLLADPRDAANIARINRMIKNRELFRPFAPSVLEESLANIMELPPTSADYSFMTFVLPVQAPARRKLAAVTHVDGTARVQSVSRDVDCRYWSLIREFEKLTGVPVLLNTSLNNHAEPIVNSVDDAVTLLLTSPIDLLVVGDHVVTRREPPAGASVCGRLCPAVPMTIKLVRRQVPDEHSAADAFALEATASRSFVEDSVPLSPPAYRVLSVADGTTTTDALCRALALPLEERDAVVESMEELWRNRAITMRPAPC